MKTNNSIKKLMMANILPCFYIFCCTKLMEYMNETAKAQLRNCF